MTTIKFWKYLAFALPVAVIGSVYFSQPVQLSDERIAELEYEESERYANGDDDHGALRMVSDKPGIKNPTFLVGSDVTLEGSLRVIGIMFEGKAFAFVKRAMADSGPHIVNCVVNHKPLSVSYCNLVDCSRALTGAGNVPLDLRLGGQDGNMQMVFSYNGTRYGQQSSKLPLQNVPTEVASLKDWLAKHPDSQVFGQEYIVQ